MCKDHENNNTAAVFAGKLITDEASWENYWLEKMKLSGNIELSFMGIS